MNAHALRNICTLCKVTTSSNDGKADSAKIWLLSIGWRAAIETASEPSMRSASSIYWETYQTASIGAVGKLLLTQTSKMIGIMIPPPRVSFR